jgi:predicted  nucleic acid-binding Zn-ribbon protein
MDKKLFDQFVIETSKRISELRSEAAKYRHQRNEARTELAQIQAELDAMRGAK